MRLANKIIVVLLLFFLLPFAFSQETSKIFLIYLEFDGGTILNNGLSVEEGYPFVDLSPSNSSFDAKIIDSEGNVLYSTRFMIDLILFDPPTLLNKTNHVLRMPYYERADKIKIFDSDDNLVLTIDTGSILNIEKSPFKIKNKKADELNRGKNLIFYLFGFILLLLIAILYFAYQKQMRKKYIKP